MLHDRALEELASSLRADRSDVEMLVLLATIPSLSPGQALSPGFPALSVTVPQGWEAPVPLSSTYMQKKNEKQTR